MNDFQSLPAMEEWITNRFQPTLIMAGPSGSGKTQFAKSLASEYGWKILIVNHREGLKQLTREHDAVFLDDFSLQDLDEHMLLALLERNDSRTLRILHGSVTKKKDLKQLFAFHKKVLRHYFRRDEYLRRCHIVPIPSDFIVNVNVVNNINITNHNHIYNNPETIKANKQAIMDIEKSKD